MSGILDNDIFRHRTHEALKFFLSLLLSSCLVTAVVISVKATELWSCCQRVHRLFQRAHGQVIAWERGFQEMRLVPNCRFDIKPDTNQSGEVQQERFGADIWATVKPQFLASLVDSGELLHIPQLGDKRLYQRLIIQQAKTHRALSSFKPDRKCVWFSTSRLVTAQTAHIQKELMISAVLMSHVTLCLWVFESGPVHVMARIKYACLTFSVWVQIAAQCHVLYDQ